MTCQALIQQGPRKGEVCGNYSEDRYCSKHIRQTIVNKANSENIRYCDISRSCYTILEENEKKCKHCLKKSQIRERKREDKKRQDTTLCLDCATTLTSENRAKGKHDKELRRCIRCYDKLLKIEENRQPRQRNYKAEGFKNKHVVWNHYVKGSKKRGIDFKLTKEKFNSLIIQKCFYCDYQKEGEVNGIDRIDNNKGYIDENIVSCCHICNFAKRTQHPQEFIDKMISIHKYHKFSTEIYSKFIDKWKMTYLSKSVPKFTNYSKSANTRNIDFKLSELEFNVIISNPCYLCGLQVSEINKNGIDRVKNSIGYLLDNCKACCGHCNLLKNILSLEDILETAEVIYTKYDDLTLYFKKIDINISETKNQARNKLENPIEGISTEREYKSLNEIIISKEIPKEIPKEIKNILQDKPVEKYLKQWKVKQIYEAISTNNENEYKEYCEQNNDISKITDWGINWASFVLSIKGKSQKESEPIIRAFVENLRRIRHNELCYNKNSKIVERDNREQWPATTVVRAFLENKLDTFKAFTEEQTGDSSDDPVWQKRWELFIKSLEDNKNNNETLKELCSKFMTAQRVKRYRRKHKS